MEIFPLLLGFLCISVVHAGCNKKIIVLSMFKPDSTCDLSDGNKCGGLVKSFLDSCSNSVNDKKREQIALLLPDYTMFTLCFLGIRGDCDSISIGLNDVILVPDQSFDIEKNLVRLLQAETASCIDESVAIILTDIPCSDFASYPDIQELFGVGEPGHGLNNTIKLFNTQLFLHTVIIWLTSNSSDLAQKPCQNLQEYPFNQAYDALQLSYSNYSNLGSYGGICDETFPQLRNGSGTNGRREGMSPGLRTGLIVGCSVVFVGILIAIAFCMLKVRRRYLESKIDMFAEEHAFRARRLFFGDSRPMDEWEITPKELKVEAETVLGTGISATVYKGHMKKKRDGVIQEMEVAVKFAHSYADQSVRKDMIREIEFMKTLGKHDNLLIMVGCVKDPENPVIATEFCVHGDLLKVLRKHDLHFVDSEKCSDAEVCLLLADILRIASEVCAGMAHLASLKYVHRDLAARNVMLNGDLVAKVGDFGLCRLASESLYIQKGGKLPIKHMSYEALKFGEFSEKSDVWAYGIMLYEFFSGGLRPFPDIETEELINHLENDGKPEFPAQVPEQLIRMVNSKCFIKKSDARATFAEIQEEIDRIWHMFDI